MNSIGRAIIDGSGVSESFITGLNGPQGVAVDSTHVFWSSFETASIGRANPNGTSPNHGFSPRRWYCPTMRATIDKAGRLVIPKRLRDDLGLRPGVVEVHAEGAGLRVEPVTEDSLQERDGRLVIPAAGAAIDDELVRGLRNAGQR